MYHFYRSYIALCTGSVNKFGNTKCFEKVSQNSGIFILQPKWTITKTQVNVANPIHNDFLLCFVLTESLGPFEYSFFFGVAIKRRSTLFRKHQTRLFLLFNGRQWTLGAAILYIYVRHKSGRVTSDCLLKRNSENSISQQLFTSERLVFRILRSWLIWLLGSASLLDCFSVVLP